MSNSLKPPSNNLADDKVHCDICGEVGSNRLDAFGRDEGRLVLDMANGASLYNWINNKDEHLV